MNIFPVERSYERFVKLNICFIGYPIADVLNVLDLFMYPFMLSKFCTGHELFKKFSCFNQVLCITFKQRKERVVFRYKKLKKTIDIHIYINYNKVKYLKFMQESS